MYILYKCPQKKTDGDFNDASASLTEPFKACRKRKIEAVFDELVEVDGHEDVTEKDFITGTDASEATEKLVEEEYNINEEICLMYKNAMMSATSGSLGGGKCVPILHDAVEDVNVVSYFQVEFRTSEQGKSILKWLTKEETIEVRIILHLSALFLLNSSNQYNLFTYSTLFCYSTALFVVIL